MDTNIHFLPHLECANGILAVILRGMMAHFCNVVQVQSCNRVHVDQASSCQPQGGALFHGVPAHSSPPRRGSGPAKPNSPGKWTFLGTRRLRHQGCAVGLLTPKLHLLTSPPSWGGSKMPNPLPAHKPPWGVHLLKKKADVGSDGDLEIPENKQLVSGLHLLLPDFHTFLLSSFNP